MKQTLKCCGSSEEPHNMKTKTMCAFLNNKGGHIIYGINDKTGRIDGFPCSNKLFDDIQLFVDQSYNFIVHTNNTIVHNILGFLLGFSKNFSISSLQQLQSFDVLNSFTKYVL